MIVAIGWLLLIVGWSILVSITVNMEMSRAAKVAQLALLVIAFGFVVNLAPVVVPD